MLVVLLKASFIFNNKVINDDELKDITGSNGSSTLYIGKSAIYKDKDVYVKLNDLMANHVGIFGNTGSGKSWGVARLVQNMFSNPELISYNANIFYLWCLWWI